ncbi:C40 family peptidase [Pelagibacterales bacterium SAG-MED22]|nr:C40 family peptidase [Pelagibacterales bacterium SAG-MED22]
MKNNFYFKEPFSNIYKLPNILSEVTSQILYGERFKILSKKKGWIKIKSLYDRYSGFIKDKKYVKELKISHKVSNIEANIFKNPNTKTKRNLYFGSKLSVLEKRNGFARFDKNQWVKSKDIKKITHKEKNFVKILKLFLKTKYVWGGKTNKGIDCSALLQIFFYYNNLFYPRDTKDQINYSIKKISKKFKKGDIIFWKGHVAICINSKQLIHAYGPEKRVIVMPINKTIKMILDTANLKVRKISKINF